MTPRKNKKFKDKVIQGNKLIDKNLVSKHEELEKELQRLGVEIRPKFTLSPPLDSRHYIFYNE
jgi:hypothetical protein